MTDEEKKAIEYWKTHMKILHWNTQLASEHYIKVLLDLIEKQSKEIEEIEELKEENKKYIVQLTDEQYRKLVDIIRDKTSKEWKDKIKAICQKKRNQIFSCTYVDEKQWRPFDRAIDAINDLEQSLLEKET